MCLCCVTPWQSSQWGQGSDLRGLVLLGRKVTNEKLLYRTIKYENTTNEMGLSRYFMDELYR